MSKISVGIKIGTSEIKIVVLENHKNETGVKTPKLLGIGFAESRGLRYGSIINKKDFTESLKEAISKAEKSSKIRIKEAYISLGGANLFSITSKGSVMVSKADNEITDLDIKNALKASEENIPSSFSLNKEIIHKIPVSYKVDDEVIYEKPDGMKGGKLEAKVLFVAFNEKQYFYLREIIEGDLGIDIVGALASPIAESIICLTKSQKMIGSMIMNIGHDTTSIIVYENMNPVSLEVFKIGSSKITSDLALAFKIPIDEAEKVKISWPEESLYSKKKIAEIIERNFAEIFELTESHLKKIGRNELLPAGVMLVGGGSMTSGVENLAKEYLNLPAKVLTVSEVLKGKEINLKDSSWFVSCGLGIFGLVNEQEENLGIKVSNTKAADFLKRFFKVIVP